MNIEITLQNAHLKAKNLQSHHMTDAIQGFFSVLKGESVKYPVQPQASVAAPSTTITQAVITIPKPSAPVEKMHVTAVCTNEGTKSPKVLPKIDDQRSLNVSVAERVEAQQEQEHWKSGIKVDEDGTKRYRCYYWCDCGSKGKRYIHEYDELVSCRECGQEMYVEVATPNHQDNGLPKRDKFGNFFIARETAKISD